MPFYYPEKDVSVLRSINKELIENIISTTVVLYKIALSETKSNLYGESLKKVYYGGIQIYCLIDRDTVVYSGNEEGQDYTQPIIISFLKDTLREMTIVPEIGDIIFWDREYYELDSLDKNQYLGGINPESDITIKEFGWDISLVFSGHRTRISKLNLMSGNQGQNQIQQTSKK